MGDARLRRGARVPRDAWRTTSSTPLGGRAGDRARDAARRRARRCDFYIDATPCGRHPLLGHRRARPRRARRLGSRPADPFNDHEPVDSSAAAIARAGPAAARPPADAPRRRTGSATRRPACASLDTLLRRGGPYLSQRPGPSGPAAALGLSLAERLGPRAAGRARSRAASRASGATTTCARWRSTCSGWRSTGPYLDVLRPGRHDGRDRTRAACALVTGGTRGIGLGIARALARGGLGPRAQRRPAGSRRRGRARGAARARRRRALLRADIAAATIARARRASARRASAASTRSSTTPGARRASRADLLDAGEESFEELMRTNLQGPYFLTQAVARDMMARSGTRRRGSARAIVFVTSVSAELASTEPRRVLRQQGRPGDGRAAVRRAARRRRDPGLRGAARASSPPT